MLSTPGGESLFVRRVAPDNRRPSNNHQGTWTLFFIRSLIHEMSNKLRETWDLAHFWKKANFWMGACIYFWMLKAEKVAFFMHSTDQIRSNDLGWKDETDHIVTIGWWCCPTKCHWNGCRPCAYLGSDLLVAESRWIHVVLKPMFFNDLQFKVTN